MYVNNAFLLGDLKEEVYMTLHPRFKASRSNKVCRLQKSLYRLKQALWQWFAKLSLTLLEYGLVQSYANYSLLTYKKGDKFVS